MSARTIRTDPEALGREIVDRVGSHVRLALPLGLGKAVTVANALTRLAEQDASIRLEILTALTLERPTPRSALEARFLEPAMDRLFGAYPTIRYAELQRQDALPPNISVNEFFFMAGNRLGNRGAQSSFITANYTHALHVLLERGPNVIAQLLAREDGRLSLSCNTDITADLLDARRADDAQFLMVGEINPELPFMDSPAVVDSAEVDLLLDDPGTQFELFSAVKRPVSLADHAIGLHVSTLVPDGGTLQIGIGQIGDAIASALLLRHARPETTASIVNGSPFPGGAFAEAGRFEEGLYVVTEMLVEGLLALFEAGIVRREAQGACMHAGFFLDSRTFYRRLRAMPEKDRAGIAMMPVSFTNQLYGGEAERRSARRNARFVNAAMKVTALGGAVSDATSDGEIVSGVGGQFDFVSQAHALSGGRSVITLNATRQSGGRTVSNIVWDHPHETIPRHLRDVVVTEYGISDLRGRTDEAAILALVGIADSRFQPGLLARAKSAGKLTSDADIPAAHRRNTPDRLSEWLALHRERGALPAFPFGSDFDETERRLLPALACLKQASGSWGRMLRLAAQAAGGNRTDEDRRCLERLDLATDRSPKEILQRLLVLGALAETRGSPLR